MDPEFYKYLQQNDKELLDFEASSDEDDGDDKDKDVHKPPEELEGHSDESDFEEDATGGEYVEDGTVRKVTLAMVSKWRGGLQTKGKPLQTIAIVTKAFHAALYRILEEEDDQPVKFKVEGGGIFNAVVQLCVVELKPAILRLLKLPADSAKISVESNKMWPRVKALLKHYMMDLIKLLGAVSSPDIVSVLLKHLHGMLMFLPVLAFNSKPLLRQLVALWSKSDDEPVRIIAFLNLLRVTVNNKRKYLETVLKYMYTSYVANSKFVSHATLPNINFMRSSLAEMFSLDESVAYTHAFLYIRQLAIHLRNAITLHSKQAYQTVYNWQYVAALKLWTSLLTTSYANDKKQLSSLLYPLVQVIIGVIKLIPTSTYFPLRFHCVDLLNQISSETGLFIPTAPLILEIFQIYDLNKRHSKVSMKPLDFTCILRLNKIHLVENGFKTSVVDCVYQHLLNYMQNESSRISFPDLCIPVVSQLRAFVKASKVPNYSRKIKQLLDKIEDTSRFVEEERRKAALPLSNRDGIKTWEGAVKAKGTPLMSFYAAWKKINDQREAKKFTDNETMADFKLPTLKKQVPKAKKARTEEDGQVDLFPSDDEDDDIGFGADSEEEEEEEDLEEEEEEEVEEEKPEEKEEECNEKDSCESTDNDSDNEEDKEMQESEGGELQEEEKQEEDEEEDGNNQEGSKTSKSISKPDRNSSTKPFNSDYLNIDWLVHAFRHGKVSTHVANIINLASIYLLPLRENIKLDSVHAASYPLLSSVAKLLLGESSKCKQRQVVLRVYTREMGRMKVVRLKCEDDGSPDKIVSNKRVNTQEKFSLDGKTTIVTSSTKLNTQNDTLTKTNSITQSRLQDKKVSILEMANYELEDRRQLLMRYLHLYNIDVSPLNGYAFPQEWILFVLSIIYWCNTSAHVNSYHVKCLVVSFIYLNIVQIRCGYFETTGQFNKTYAKKLNEFKTKLQNEKIQRKKSKKNGKNSLRKDEKENRNVINLSNQTNNNAKDNVPKTSNHKNNPNETDNHGTVNKTSSLETNTQEPIQGNDHEQELCNSPTNPKNNVPKNIQETLTNTPIEKFIFLYEQLLQLSHLDERLRSNHTCFNKDVIHVLCEYQSLFYVISMFNSILNCPFEEVDMSRVYSGTFLYNLYAKVYNKDNNIPLLFEHCDELFGLYNFIVDFVQDNTVSNVFQTNVKKPKRKKKKKEKSTREETEEEEKEVSEEDGEIEIDSDNIYSILQNLHI
uniref:Nucleolar complex protein 2 homolog n=1 Tax=Cacopsylla melanoneura TaxID=428564 RepID=A0A8D9BVY5_9HEMI